MITSLLLTSILISNFAVGSQARFHDMSDEDFSDFVDAHADMLETVVEFVANGGKVQVLFERGVVGTATGIAIKYISSHAGAVYLVGGAVEIAKGLYTDIRSNDSKDQKIEEMSRQIEALVKRVNELERNANGNLLPSLGDLSAGHGHENRNQNTGRDDIRTSVYGLGDRTFTTDSRETGPHRSGYREYRDSSTREIRDTVDRIYHDSMRDRSNDNYVERK